VSISASGVCTGTLTRKSPLFHHLFRKSTVRTTGARCCGKCPLKSGASHNTFQHKALASAGSCRTFPPVGPITSAGVDALLVLTDPLTLERHVSAIVALAQQTRLPAMYPWRSYVEAGGLMVYGASLPDIHRRAATYVDKILKGAKPADLPVEQPTTFELVINLKSAEALGLTIPPSLLFQATEVIR